MSRPLAYGLGLGLVVAVLLPSGVGGGGDSFPFSTYPMFTAKRDTVWLTQLVAVYGATRHPVRPALLGAGTEVMQAAATLRRSAARGPEAAQRLCEEVAERARRELPPAERDFDALEVVSSQFDPVTYFVDRREPLARRVLASCARRAGP